MSIVKLKKHFLFVICNQHLLKMLAVRNFFSTSHLHVFFFFFSADFLSVYFQLNSLLFLSLLGIGFHIWY